MSSANWVSVDVSRSFSSSTAVVAPAPEGSEAGFGQLDFYMFLLKRLPPPSRNDEVVLCCIRVFL